MALSYRSRALSALAVALPVPLLAALGLSMPLPASVERLAARLVPFAAQSELEPTAPAHGTIVARRGEAQLVHVKVRDASGQTKVVTVPRTAVRKGKVVTPGGEVVAAVGDPTPISAPASAEPVASATADVQHGSGPTQSAARAPAPAPTPTPTQTQTQTPSPAPAAPPAPTPTQQAVDNVTTAVDNTVSNVSNTTSNTVTTATDTVNNTVTTVTDTTKNVVGGLLGGQP